jgi:transposase
MAQAIDADYGQQFLFPPALEDWVAVDHPARYLREFVDSLDLGAMGFAMPACAEGRPPYAPRLLLKIWLYGYFHRIRSTRKLEVACREHLSLVWLTGMIQPDHNSLWRFWAENKEALRELFKKTVQVAMHTGCIGLVLQAVDGTKIEAAASNGTGLTKKRMEKILAALDEAVNESEAKITADHQEHQTGYRLPPGLVERQALREKIKAGLAQLNAEKRNHYHPAEPQARRMKLRSAIRFAYNAQAVVDSQNGIVIAAETTQEETDFGQLVPMIEQAKANVGTPSNDTVTVADSHYGSGGDLQAAEVQKLKVLAPSPTGNAKKDKPYGAHHFRYDVNEQTVTCPQGVRLDHEGQTQKKGYLVQRYRCHCKDCPVQGQCTKDAKGRQVEIWPYTPLVQRMRERLRQVDTYRLWKQRGQIIERQFGQVKQHDGFRRWTVWGLRSVRAQWLMICATLNLRVLYQKWLSNRPVTPPNHAVATL